MLKLCLPDCIVFSYINYLSYFPIADKKPTGIFFESVLRTGLYSTKLSGQEKTMTATAAWIGHGILEINGAGVSGRTPDAIEKEGHPFGVPPVAMAL